MAMPAIDHVVARRPRARGSGQGLRGLGFQPDARSAASLAHPKSSDSGSCSGSAAHMVPEQRFSWRWHPVRPSPARTSRASL
jgi:hypothetical protein